MTEQTEKTTIIDAERKANYTKTRAASGAQSLNNGDEVAQALVGLTTEDVYTVADRLLKGNVDLQEKYKHLNPGMQRMVVGNRIRAALKKEDGPTIDQLVKITAPIQKRNAVAAERAAKAKEREKAAAAKAKAK